MSSLVSRNSLSGSRRSTSIRAPQWYSSDCRDDLYWYANLFFCSNAKEICCSLLSQQIYQEKKTWWRNISRRNIYASAKYRNEIDNNSSTASPRVGRYELRRSSYFFSRFPCWWQKVERSRRTLAVTFFMALKSSSTVAFGISSTPCNYDFET